jgi:hypothetical protein
METEPAEPEMEPELEPAEPETEPEPELAESETEPEPEPQPEECGWVVNCCTRALTDTPSWEAGFDV